VTDIEATSSTRLNRHDPQKNLKRFDISMGSAPPKPSADELLTERFPPRWAKLSQTKIPPAGRRQNYLAAKIHPKSPYFLQGLEISENNTGQQGVQTSAPTKEKVPFLSLFLDWKGSRAGGIPNSRAQHQPWRFEEKEI